MRRPNSNTLEELAGLLSLLFYALLSVALLAVLTGAAGSGLLLLIVGGCVHVARVGAEGAIALPRAPLRRSQPRRGVRAAGDAVRAQGSAR